MLIPAAYLGHAAGLATSGLWTATSLFFTAAGRRIGPTAVNGIRIFFAIGLLSLVHRLVAGHWLPAADERQLVYLALSGVIGLVLGDQALFTSFIQIGPRLAVLIMMTTAPIFAAMSGLAFLGETLTWTAWLGIWLTILGVGWVVLERPRAAANPHTGRRLQGMLLALVAAACQAGGLLLSKQGMGHGWLPPAEHMEAQPATLLRMFFAGLGMLPLLWWHWRRERLRRRAGVSAAPRRWPSGIAFTLCGAIVGPFLGVWMSLEAADRLDLGIAQTLCSLPPVLILPFSRLVYREHISLRAVFGACVAVVGVAVLVWASAEGQHAG